MCDGGCGARRMAGCGVEDQLHCYRLSVRQVSDLRSLGHFHVLGHELQVDAMVAMGWTQVRVRSWTASGLRLQNQGRWALSPSSSGIGKVSFVALWWLEGGWNGLVDAKSEMDSRRGMPSHTSHVPAMAVRHAGSMRGSRVMWRKVRMWPGAATPNVGQPRICNEPPSRRTRDMDVHDDGDVAHHLSRAPVTLHINFTLAQMAKETVTHGPPVLILLPEVPGKPTTRVCHVWFWASGGLCWHPT